MLGKSVGAWLGEPHRGVNRTVGNGLPTRTDRRYATATASTQGQVRGGRWKPLHYFFESFLFSDVIVACGNSATCYLR